MSTSTDLVDRLRQAGDYTGERVWELPCGTSTKRRSKARSPTSTTPAAGGGIDRGRYVPQALRRRRSVGASGHSRNGLGRQGQAVFSRRRHWRGRSAHNQTAAGVDQAAGGERVVDSAPAPALRFRGDMLSEERRDARSRGCLAIWPVSKALFNIRATLENAGIAETRRMF